MPRTPMHEALIQLRSHRSFTRAEMRELEQMLSRYIQGKLELDHYDEGFGVDVYIPSLGLARRVASKMARLIGGKISESAKYIGSRGGKRRYRFTILVRC